MDPTSTMIGSKRRTNRRRTGRLALALGLLALGAVVLPSDLGGPGLASARECEPTLQDISTGGDKLAGTQDAPGTADAQWTVSFGSSNQNAHSITGLVPPWVKDPLTANWVNPWGPTYTVPNDNALPGGAWSAPTVTYWYRVAFTLDFTKYDRATLDFRYAADDVAVIRANDRPSPIATAGVLTTTAGFAQWHQVLYTEDYSSPVRLVHGLNYIDIAVTNWILYTGLVVDGVVRQSCDALPCEGAGFEEDLSTGVTLLGIPDLPTTMDPDWYIELLADQWVASDPAYSLVAHTAWAPSTAANWINHLGGMSRDGDEGNYTYVIQFQLPCIPTDCSRLSLDIEYAADNDVWFDVNGITVSTTQVNAFTPLLPLSVGGCAPFVAGINRLGAHVFNEGGPTGLLVTGGVEIAGPSSSGPADPGPSNLNDAQ